MSTIGPAERDILVLARALTRAERAGIARLADGELIVHREPADSTSTDHEPLTDEQLRELSEGALAADPEVHVADVEGAGSGPAAAVAVADALGGVHCVLFVEGADADRALLDHLRISGSQLTRLLDTAEEQHQLREVSLTMSETSAMLASQLDQAERSNHDLENFAFIASHELRRPLTAISGVAEVLAQTLAADQPYDREFHRTALSTIQADARRLQDQIDALLSISRSTPSAAHIEPVDLRDVLRDAVRELDPLIDATGAVVTGTSLGIILGDRSALATVIRNLVSNSLVYRHPGRRPIVDVSMGADGGTVTVSVVDNGVGISPDLVPEVFDLFRRGPTDQPGTGIGLAVSKRVVESLDGSIGVESTEGQGSTFWFTLPQPE